jgi:phosphoadenosine phosphosulfate reductase
MRLPLVNPTESAGAMPATAAGDAGGAADPQRLIAWAFERFEARRMVVTTGFGMEGCAMLDMVATLGRRVEIHWIDTSFLFAEIHELRARLAARYPLLEFVRHATIVTPQEQAARHGPELWNRDPDLCCRIRKVEPMGEILAGADAWMTAVRRDQATTRAALEPVAWDPMFELVKISPLAGWSRAEVWAHVQRHAVPYNPLHDRGYPSVGCVQCTSPVEGSRPEEYSREGRWAGHGKLECGLHHRRRELPTSGSAPPPSQSGPSGGFGLPSASGLSPSSTNTL